MSGISQVQFSTDPKEAPLVRSEHTSQATAILTAALPFSQPLKSLIIQFLFIDDHRPGVVYPPNSIGDAVSDKTKLTKFMHQAISKLKDKNENLLHLATQRMQTTINNWKEVRLISQECFVPEFNILYTRQLSQIYDLSNRILGIALGKTTPSSPFDCNNRIEPLPCHIHGFVRFSLTLDDLDALTSMHALVQVRKAISQYELARGFPPSIPEEKKS